MIQYWLILRHRGRSFWWFFVWLACNASKKCIEFHANNSIGFYIIHRCVYQLITLKWGSDSKFCFLYVGDSAPHDIYSIVNQSFIQNSNKYITNLLLEAFPDTEVFPSIGNHDVFPVDEAKPGVFSLNCLNSYILKLIFCICKWIILQNKSI